MTKVARLFDCGLTLIKNEKTSIKNGDVNIKKGSTSIKDGKNRREFGKAATPVKAALRQKQLIILAEKTFQITFAVQIRSC